MVKRTTKKFINGPMPVVDKLRYYLHTLNTHPMFIGLMVIMLNIGSKYITIKLSKSQEQYIKNSLGRQFLIFAIMCMQFYLLEHLLQWRIICSMKRVNIVLFQII